MSALSTATTLPISIEFFPPQTAEGMEKLRATRAKLSVLKPEFFSVTYGAGGSTQARTFEAVFDIQQAGDAAALSNTRHSEGQFDAMQIAEASRRAKAWQEAKLVKAPR